MLCGARCAGARPRAPDYAGIVAAPDRADADRTADARRKPAQLLAFIGVRPGMKVLDMETSAGYTAELLARVVGPTGKVFAQDSAAVIERFVKDKFDIRAKKPVMANVVHVVRDFDDPIPPEASNLDLITFFFAYHDITYMPVDRAVMNKKMFAALKPGGFLIISDHSAKPGDGISVARTLHRIEEKVLREEIEAAGFKLVAEADFLRNPEDPREDKVFQPKIPVDEFVLEISQARIDVLEIDNLSKSYRSANETVAVLRGVDLRVAASESVALTGESGSGKSTLLHLIAGLDAADGGEIRLAGTSLAGLNDAGRAALRRDQLGLVFQQFNLIPSLSVEDNLKFQSRLAGRHDAAWHGELVERLGLGDLTRRYPEQLSGGQQQRVAIGRALAPKPLLLLADEPTGNLDEETADEVLALARDLVSRSGCGFLMVTHSARLAATLDRQVTLHAGRIR